ncbi:MAG: hypothetical protein ACYCXK_09625 [Candidatus Humimicrobiaceae bacterium]
MGNSNLLDLDLEKSIKNSSLYKKYTAELGKQGSAAGLNGGIDSSLVLKLFVEADAPN